MKLLLRGMKLILHSVKLILHTCHIFSKEYNCSVIFFGFKKGRYYMFYEMTIAGLKRQLPLCKVTDDLYIAAFIMFSDVEITKAAASEL